MGLSFLNIYGGQMGYEVNTKREVKWYVIVFDLTRNIRHAAKVIARKDLKASTLQLFLYATQRLTLLTVINFTYLHRLHSIDRENAKHSPVRQQIQYRKAKNPPSFPTVHVRPLHVRPVHRQLNYHCPLIHWPVHHLPLSLSRSTFSHPNPFHCTRLPKRFAV